MKRIAFVLVAIAMAAGVVAITAPASGQTGQAAAPIYLAEIPQGYRDLGLIAVSRLAAPNGAQLRAELGNAIAIKAYRERTLPFPDGTIVAALHWTEASSDANNKILAIGFPGAGIQSFVPGSAVNIQLMVKDSRKYSATGGWGFGDFANGKPGADAPENMLRLPRAGQRSRLRVYPLRSLIQVLARIEFKKAALSILPAAGPAISATRSGTG